MELGTAVGQMSSQRKQKKSPLKNTHKQILYLTFDVMRSESAAPADGCVLRFCLFADKSEATGREKT